MKASGNTLCKYMVAQSGHKINTNSGNNARKSFDKIRQNPTAADKRIKGRVECIKAPPHQTKTPKN